MNKKQMLWAGLFAVGLFLTASYSIDNRGFHSGIYGIVGCLMIITAYAGMNWQKLKAKDSSTRKILYILSCVLGLIVILDIAEAILS